MDAHETQSQPDDANQSLDSNNCQAIDSKSTPSPLVASNSMQSQFIDSNCTPSQVIELNTKHSPVIDTNSTQFFITDADNINDSNHSQSQITDSPETGDRIVISHSVQCSITSSNMSKSQSIDSTTDSTGLHSTNTSTTDSQIMDSTSIESQIINSNEIPIRTEKSSGRRRSKNYRCLDCNHAFKDNWHLQRHMRTHSNSKTEQEFKCFKCNTVFNSRKELVGHKKIHGAKLYECPICGRQFSDNWHLKRHMNVHDKKEKVYVCSVCNESFKQKQLLKKHEKIHPEENKDEVRYVVIVKKEDENSNNENIERSPDDLYSEDNNVVADIGEKSTCEKNEIKIEQNTVKHELENQIIDNCMSEESVINTPVLKEESSENILKIDKDPSNAELDDTANQILVTSEYLGS